MDTIKLSKTDYGTMKKMLKSHIKSYVIYNNNSYIFEDFFEYCINNTNYVECVLSYDNKKSITIPITEIIRIFYPTILLY